jgi:hypothetical protein
VCSRRVSSPRFCLPVKINFELVVLASAQRVHVFSVRELIEVVKKKNIAEKITQETFCREKKKLCLFDDFFHISNHQKDFIACEKNRKREPLRL